MSEARAQAHRAAAALLHATQRQARKAGWDLVRYPAGIAAHRRGLLLRHLDADLVIDVGADAGQYGGELRDATFVRDRVDLDRSG